MLQVRNGVFETNSSSVHSLTMCMKSDYDKWKNGELYLDRWYGKFVSYDVVKQFVEEVRNEYREYEPNYIEGDAEWEERFLDYLNEDNQYYSYDRYRYDIEHEIFFQEFETPSGDTVISFGYYGNDY